MPGFIFDDHAAHDAYFVAETGDEVSVRAWKADAQDRSRGRVGEGNWEVTEDGEGAEIGEDEAEVFDRAGEVGGQGREEVDVVEGGDVGGRLGWGEGGNESGDGGAEFEFESCSLRG